MNNNALFKIGYGLYLLTASENGFDNGCIINTFTQLTSTPIRVSVTVNKTNKTCWMIKNTGKFCISTLTEEADFDLFKRFGFQSGADTDKFAGFSYVKRSESGLLYLTKNANAYISCKVVDEIDFGTHIMFVADMVEAEVLSDAASLTYSYYFEHIKPKPDAQKKTGYRCKICGYIYEGEPLPDDFICPLCKHGASDFEKI